MCSIFRIQIEQKSTENIYLKIQYGHLQEQFLKKQKKKVNLINLKY